MVGSSSSCDLDQVGPDRLPEKIKRDVTNPSGSQACKHMQEHDVKSID